MASLDTTLNSLENALEDLAHGVLDTPAGSPARERAEAFYLEKTKEAREILAGARPGFEDPLPALLGAQDLARRVRGSQR